MSSKRWQLSIEERWAEQVHAVGDDAVGAQVDEALRGPVVVDGVGERAQAPALDLCDHGRIPQRVVAHDGYTAQLAGVVKAADREAVDEQRPRDVGRGGVVDPEGPDCSKSRLQIVGPVQATLPVQALIWGTFMVRWTSLTTTSILLLPQRPSPWCWNCVAGSSAHGARWPWPDGGGWAFLSVWVWPCWRRASCLASCTTVFATGYP